MDRPTVVNVLYVAEKPSVAKSISQVLSSKQKEGVLIERTSHSGMTIFDFEMNLGNTCRQMHVTSVNGHIMNFFYDDRYQNWHDSDPVDLFTAPVHKWFVNHAIVETLEEEARKCEELVLWLDCDFEGESIANEVVFVCTNANPRIKISRAQFSSVIDSEIRRADENLLKFDREKNQVITDSVDLRQEVDYRAGTIFTRFQHTLLRDAFVIDCIPKDKEPKDKESILSFGLCQFPTLGFIVERFWEAQAHKPEEYYLIKCFHSTDESHANFSWGRRHFFDKRAALLIHDMCSKYSTATVTKVDPKVEMHDPPHPLSTIELLKRAFKYFQMSSDQTMKIAQELYQSGYISYHRTETDGFSFGTDDLRAIVQQQTNHRDWGSYAQKLLEPDQKLWESPKGGGNFDNAHQPIFPTKFYVEESWWTADHTKLYELVVRHFLACVSKPFVATETTVEVNIAGEVFSTFGRVISNENYLSVYRYEDWDTPVVPTYSVGQKFIPTSLTIEQEETKPPPLLSEAELLNCMQNKGIGTDGTMHDHIKMLLDRYYVTKKDGRFTPTSLGEALIMGYSAAGNKLWKPDHRKVMEEDMRLVREGIKSKAEVLDTRLKDLKACFLDLRSKKVLLSETMAKFFARSNQNGEVKHGKFRGVVRVCGLCVDINMVLEKDAEKFIVRCLNGHKCGNVFYLPRSVSEAYVTSTTCSNCTFSSGLIKMIQLTFQQGKIPPNYNDKHLGCIGGCDKILGELTYWCG